MTPQPMQITTHNLFAGRSIAKITRDEHIDRMSRDEFKGGRFYYHIQDETITTPWIGLDRTGEKFEQTATASAEELIKWFDDRKNTAAMPGAPAGDFMCTNPDCLNCFGVMAGYRLNDGNCPTCGVKADPVKPKQSEGVAEVYVEGLVAAAVPEGQILTAPPQEQTLFEATPGPLFDENDPMAVLQQANAPAPEPAAIRQEEVAKAYTEGRTYTVADTIFVSPDPDDPFAHFTDDALRREVQKLEDEYFNAYRIAHNAEAELKARQQEFDRVNGHVIADKKASCSVRDTLQKKLKEFAKSYGKRTGDKQFDQYISFREMTSFDWDEAKAIAWCEQNFPAVLITAGVSIDEGRFTSYLRDCLKKKQELPDSVTVSKDLETTISSKIPTEVGS